MKKTLILSSLLAACLVVPVPGFAMEFGTIDAGRLFNNYSETQKTKAVLEAEKKKLQEKLDAMKKEFAALDEQYTATAKKIQELQQAKKDAEAKPLEDKLRTMREQLAEKQAELQKFFESSQKQLYELEDDKMGNLSKNLDAKVDATIKKIAAQMGLEAVFEKRFCYAGGKDITDAVLNDLNGGAPAPAAPAPVADPKAPKGGAKPKPR